ncbi:FimV family protein [Chitinibacter sp. S2-10]|uniref:type IV pilus assembly protein FimV n=1 Tax=Chitinibacter sp. S2-10 TaxID=3373597 RepID=UPI00397732D6
MPVLLPKTLTLTHRLALISVLLPAAGHALTLGELQLQSYIGQPFRATIPYTLNADEALYSDCISLSKADGDIPDLDNASITLRSRNERSGMLLISSANLLGEPAIKVGIRIACENLNLSRSYTAFLEVAPLTASSLPVSSRTSTKQQTITTRSSTTLADIASRYYPASSSQYSLYLDKLLDANPDYGRDTPIAIDSEIVIPTQLRSRKKPEPKPVATETGLLRLDGALSSTPQPQTMRGSDAEYARLLEQKIAELNQLQEKMQLEVTQLNMRLVQMNSAASAPQAASASMASSATTIIASTASATSIPQPAPAELTEHQAPVAEDRSSSLVFWGTLGGLIFASLVALIVFLRRRSANGSAQWQQDDELSPADDISTQESPRTIVGFLTKNTMLSMLTRQERPPNIEVQDIAYDMEHAQALIAQGEVVEAIDVLYHCIDEDPTDIERWLMLFRLFRQQGMKTEYAQLARNLRHHPHDAADWELVRNIGAKLDPENPLYLREQAKPITQAASEAPAFEHTPEYARTLAPSKPIANDLQLDLASPENPDISLMTTLMQSSSAMPFPTQVAEPENHMLDLPDLSATGEEITAVSVHDKELEELALKIQAEPDEQIGILELDLEPPEPPKDDKKSS